MGNKKLFLSRLIHGIKQVKLKAEKWLGKTIYLKVSGASQPVC